MSSFIDLTGQRFGKVVAVEAVGKRHGGYLWRFKCDCGVLFERDPYGLKMLVYPSCGCEKRRAYQESKMKPGSAFRKLLANYKNSARFKGHDFLLTEDEFKALTSSNCHYCGVSPERLYSSTSGLDTYMYNGIDRKDNSLGYVTSNSVPCCWKCNSLKGDRNYEEFLTMIKSIYEYVIINA